MGVRAELCELPASSLPDTPVSVLRLALVAGDGPPEETSRQTQATVTTQPFEPPDGTRFNRAPKDMCTWEIHASYRLAWHLAQFLPSANLAQALANWLCVAQHELERRGEWRPEALPPRSM